MVQVHELPEIPMQAHLVQNIRTFLSIHCNVVFHNCIPRTIPARAGGWALKNLKSKTRIATSLFNSIKFYELLGLFSPSKFSPKIADFLANGSPFGFLSNSSFKSLYIHIPGWVLPLLHLF